MIKRIQIAFSFLSIFIVINVDGQTVQHPGTEIWPQINIDFHLNKSFSLKNEYYEIEKGFFSNKTSWVAETGLQYKLNNHHWAALAGVAYNEEFKANGVRTELRPIQQINYTSGKTWILNNRLRIEERFFDLNE